MAVSVDSNAKLEAFLQLYVSGDAPLRISADGGGISRAALIAEHFDAIAAEEAKLQEQVAGMRFKG